MGVDNHQVALVAGIGIVLLGGLLVLFISQKNIAGQATFTGIEPDRCEMAGEKGVELRGNTCLKPGYSCEQGFCVPADRTLDTDKDGLKDYDEILFYGTNPLEEDSDGDELPDSREVIVYEAGQYIDDDSGLVTQLTDSFKRLFGID